MLSVAKTLSIPAHRSGPIAILFAAAIFVSLLIIALPIQYSLVVLGGLALLAATLIEPLIGLALMLAVGLAEPLLGAAGLLPVPFSQVAFLLFAGSWLLKGILRREILWPRLPITTLFVLYLVACALSVFFTQPASPKDAATELWKWAQMYFIAGIVYDLAKQKKIGWLVAILLLVGVIEAGIGIWQFQFRGHGPEGFRILGDHWRAYGTLEQPNPFGGFMGIVWPMAAMIAVAITTESLKQIGGTRITQIERINANFSTNQIRVNQLNPRHPRIWFSLALTALVAIAALLALFLSYSRGAWLGAGAAAFAMLIFWPRRRWVGVALGGGAIVAFLALYTLNLLPSSIANRFADVGDFVQVYDVRGVHINDTNFAIVERLAHWQAALNMADAHPLFGVGFGNYEPTYQQYRLINWQYGLGHAHNIYLNVLAETGLVGLLAYLIFWGGIIRLTLSALNSPAPTHPRFIALGLLGCWVHLATHQFLDNLYVGNIPLYLGALFGLLCLITTPPILQRVASTSLILNSDRLTSNP
jgi:O-antigen ligase